MSMYKYFFYSPTTNIFLYFLVFMGVVTIAFLLPPWESFTTIAFHRGLMCKLQDHVKFQEILPDLERQMFFCVR